MTKKRSLILSSILVLLIALFAVLWFSHMFFHVGSYRSPDGSVQTKVYSRNISALWPEKDHVTLVDEGAFQGTTILQGSFDGLWWSEDIKYEVVSLMQSGACQLTLFDFVHNTASNLNSRLKSGIYAMDEFSGVSQDADGQKLIEFRFLQWSQYDSNMLLYFSYLDTNEIDRDGYFWYNYETGQVSGVMHLDVLVFDGIMKEIGSDYYLMDLDLPDENGNTREFIFTTADTTRFSGLEALEKGEHIRIVCRGSDAYEPYPGDLLFEQSTQEAAVTARSVTKLP